MGSSILVGLVCLASGLVGIGTASAATTGARPSARASTTLTVSEFESRLFNRINVRRLNHGCHAYRANSALALAARRHTSLMSYDNELSHLLSGESGLGPRITNAGYTNWRRLAENLAWGQSSPRAVFRAWVHSDGHRANLDNCRLHDIGLGVLIRNGRPWVTADFGRRRA